MPCTAVKIAAATCLAGAAFAAPAAAQSITLGTAADRVEDVPFLVSARGVGAEDLNVYATIKPVGAVGCGATFETDADGDSVMWGEDSEGAYTASGTADVDHPGSYLLCAWMQEYASSGTAVARASAVISVRSARATLAIGGPKRIVPGRTANFTFSGTSELDRDVFATVKRVGSRGCGASRSVDEGDSFLWEDAQGHFTIQDAPWSYAIDDRGMYRVCAWVQESSSDVAPEAVATYTFRVGRVTRCERARARVTRERRAVRGAQEAVARGERGAARRLRAERRDLRSARRAARRAC
jgi:hypothetical protein